MLKDEEKLRIANILNQRIGALICPICHRGHFSLVDSYSTVPLSDDYRVMSLGGRTIPFIILACDNCGFISQHALGSLGLLSSEKG